MTLLGIVTVRNAVEEKQAFPKEVTLLGIRISSPKLQPQYLQPIITQYFIDNKSEIWLLFLIAHSKR